MCVFLCENGCTRTNAISSTQIQNDRIRVRTEEHTGKQPKPTFGLCLPRARRFNGYRQLTPRVRPLALPWLFVLCGMAWCVVACLLFVQMSEASPLVSIKQALQQIKVRRPTGRGTNLSRTACGCATNPNDAAEQAVVCVKEEEPFKFLYLSCRGRRNRWCSKASNTRETEYLWSEA